jgi:hypothetical protein
MIGTAKQVKICGQTIKLGDYLKVQYTCGHLWKGRTIEGKVVELWSGEHLQGRLSCGWCFHDHDRILTHDIYEDTTNAG